MYRLDQGAPYRPHSSSTVMIEPHSKPLRSMRTDCRQSCARDRDVRGRQYQRVSSRMRSRSSSARWCAPHPSCDPSPTRPTSAPTHPHPTIPRQRGTHLCKLRVGER